MTCPFFLLLTSNKLSRTTQAVTVFGISYRSHAWCLCQASWHSQSNSALNDFPPAWSSPERHHTMICMPLWHRLVSRTEVKAGIVILAYLWSLGWDPNSSLTKLYVCSPNITLVCYNRKSEGVHFHKTYPAAAAPVKSSHHSVIGAMASSLSAIRIEKSVVFENCCYPSPSLSGPI